MNIEIVLRAAKLNDATMLLRWRNDPTTVNSTRKEQPVTEAEHARWLADALSLAAKHAARHAVLIAERGGVAVGTGRITPSAFGPRCHLHWTVAPEHRGQGLGTQLVQALVRQATAMGYALIGARIRAQNRASLNAAYRGGVHSVELLP